MREKLTRLRAAVEKARPKLRMFALDKSVDEVVELLDEIIEELERMRKL